MVGTRRINADGNVRCSLHHKYRPEESPFRPPREFHVDRRSAAGVTSACVYCIGEHRIAHGKQQAHKPSKARKSDGWIWCKDCKSYCPPEDFWLNTTDVSGYQTYCKKHGAARDKRRRGRMDPAPRIVREEGAETGAAMSFPSAFALDRSVGDAFATYLRKLGVFPGFVQAWKSATRAQTGREVTPCFPTKRQASMWDEMWLRWREGSS
jgi:hypothetical protein